MFRRWIFVIIVTLVFVAAGSISAQTFDNASTFTYQGHLADNGNAFTGNCDFQFSLFDAMSGGSQIGSTENVNGVTVSNGVFTAELDFGAEAFSNGDRYLSIIVNCGGGAQALTPRQPVTPAPLAMSLPALVTLPNATSPNILGGYSGNSIIDNPVGAVIAGGGNSGSPNTAYDNYVVIGGGAKNIAGTNNNDPADANYATISGGNNNQATKNYATIGGGTSNQATGAFSIVAGGSLNQATDTSTTVAGGGKNQATQDYAAVGGGLENIAQANYATIAGGGPTDPQNSDTTNNVVYDNYGTVGGGGGNRAGSDDGQTQDITNAPYTTIGGGRDNQSDASYATIGGGRNNTVQAFYATIAGGGPSDPANNPTTTNNAVYDNYGTIGGGGGNRAGSNDGQATNAPYATISGGINNRASGSTATVGGGSNNQSTNAYTSVGGGFENQATGYASTVAGGFQNIARGDYSFVAGRNGNLAAAADNTFLWADGTYTDVVYGANQFLVISSGGATIYTSNGNLSTGVTVAAGGGSWSSVSDRNVKENIETVDSVTVLEAVIDMPISTWNYIEQGDGVLHMGPMAQDFYGAFGLGVDDKHIATIDADGVALAAIQGLYDKLEAQEARITRLENLLKVKQSGINILALTLVGTAGYMLAMRRRKDVS